MEWVFGIVSLVYIIIAIAVLRRHYTRPASAYLFAAFCFSVVLWTIIIYFSLFHNEFQLLFIRLAMVAASIQMVLFYFFTESFIRSQKLSSPFVIFPIIFSITIMILSLTPFVFSGLSNPTNSEQPVPIVGRGIVLFMIAVTFFIGGGLTKLFQGIRLVSGVRLKQRYYILLGSLGTFGLILVLILFNVVFFKNTNAVLFAPYYIIPFILTTGYAMVRYRFLEMSRAIIRIIAFTIPVLVFTGTIAILVIKFDFSQNANLRLLIIMLSALAFTIIVTRGGVYLEKIILESYLRPAEIRDRLTMLANKYHSLSRFEKALEEEVRRTSKTSLLKLFTVNKDGKFQTSDFGPLEISNDDLMVKYFQEYTSILLCDEIPLMKFGVGYIKELQSLQRISEFMKGNSFEIAIPLGHKNQLVGIAFLSIERVPKNFSQVMQGLETLKIDATTGLQNLLLYRTSLDLIGVRGLK